MINQLIVTLFPTLHGYFTADCMVAWHRELVRKTTLNICRKTGEREGVRSNLSVSHNLHVPKAVVRWETGSLTSLFFLHSKEDEAAREPGWDHAFDSQLSYRLQMHFLLTFLPASVPGLCEPGGAHT